MVSFQMKSVNLRDLGDGNDLVSSRMVFKACLLRSLGYVAWLTQNGLKCGILHEIEQMTSPYEAWCNFVGKVRLVGLNMTYMRWAGHWFEFWDQNSSGFVFWAEV